jgi:hypothetical protein
VRRPLRESSCHDRACLTFHQWFGEPIDTTRFAGQDDDTAARAVRDEVKQAVMAGIQFLRDERDKDPDRDLAKRLLRRPQ